MFKIGILAVLLGAFGLLGSSTFAQSYTPPSASSYIPSTTQTTTQTTTKPSNYVETKSAGNGVTSKTSAGNGVTSNEPSVDFCAAKGMDYDIMTKSCVKAAVPKTKQEECEAKGSDWQWNGSLEQADKCESCSAPGVCCGVELNTDVPFVGKCIRLGSSASSDDTTVVTDTTAFPRLMGGLTKILTTLILLACFGGILAGGVMIASSGGKEANATKGKELIKNVVIAMALLGTSGIILKLINPNFFG